MKKAIKIAAAILAVLIAAAAVIFIFFPGLPTYIKVKLKYEYIDRTIEDLPTVGVPDSFKPFTVKGVTFSAPADAEKKELGSSVRFGEKGVVLVMENDKLETARSLEELGMGTDKWDGYQYTEAEYRHFFEKSGEKYPTDEDASSDILWFFRDRLTASDCLKLRSEDKNVFLEFAEIKEESWGMEESFRLSGDGFTGYAARSTGDQMPDGMWTVTLYPDGGGSRYYFVMVRNCGDETAKQIISSITLEK